MRRVAVHRHARPAHSHAHVHAQGFCKTRIPPEMKAKTEELAGAAPMLLRIAWVGGLGSLLSTAGDVQCVT